MDLAKMIAKEMMAKQAKMFEDQLNEV